MTPKKYYDTNSIPVDQGYVFVLLMEDSKDIYEGYIKDAADTLGLRCESCLDLVGPGNALHDILERIKKAEILIFDITGFSPDVILELGIALTIKDEDKIIVIRKSSDTEIHRELPFNIYQHRVSFSYNQSTLDELRESLIDVMRDINRRGSVRDKPVKSHEVKKLMDSAINAIDQKEWTTAEVLFDNMSKMEPENWYIFNQWGIMYRSKNDYESALSKFQQALEYTKYAEERTYVYIERGLLFQMNRKTNEAEDCFRKAEKADNKNKYLYIVWAKLYEELKDYRKAQDKINYILGELDSNDLDCQLRYEYYHEKDSRPDFSISFDEYKTNEYKLRDRNDGNVGVTKGNTKPFLPRRPKGIPWDITLEELKENYIGKVVEGVVNVAEPYIGVFVTLSRDFTGLIYWKYLKSGFEDRYKKNQIIKVKIKGISVEDGKVKMALSFIDGDLRSISREQINQFNKNAKLDSHQKDEIMGQTKRYLQKIKSHEVRKLMDSAFSAIKQKEWITAEVLFNSMNKMEPGNWYIYNQWGIMHRSKNEFESALSKFQKALEYTKYEEERAYIYIERGLLFQVNQKTSEAEDWFRKAEKADKKNKYLYIVWAKLYEELKDYQNARNKINYILGELDSNDQECKLRYNYYQKKIIWPDFSMSFDEYKNDRYMQLERYLSRLKDDPENSDILNKIKDVYHSLGNKEETEKVEEKLKLLAENKLQECLSNLNSEPENLDMLDEAKTLYQELGENEKAGRMVERRRHIVDKKEFEYNLKESIVLQQVQLHHLGFFGDFNWTFQPGMNVLLGRNGYGKSHLLRFLVALLQKNDENISEFFLNSRITPNASLIVERENNQELISRKIFGFDKTIGRVPVLAIPDMRLIDKSQSAVNIPKEEKRADLGQYWSYHFLYQQPIEGPIRRFLYEMCINYLDKGKTFNLPILRLIRDILKKLSDNSFDFYKIDPIGGAEFKILVNAEGSQKPIPLQKASQGTLSVFSIIGLIYFYLQSIFPEASEKDLLNKPAIVFIDELDAHLHPSWQQKIVGILRKSFPNIQFIVTAHSPLVVAGCKEGEIAVFRKGENGFCVHAFEHDFIGYEAKELYEKVFEIEEKDQTYLKYISMSPFKKEIEDKIKQLEEKKALSEKEEKELKQLYDEIYYIEKAGDKFQQRRGFSKLMIENKKLKTKLRSLEGQSSEEKTGHSKKKP